MIKTTIKGIFKLFFMQTVVTSKSHSLKATVLQRVAGIF